MSENQKSKASGKRYRVYEHIMTDLGTRWVLAVLARELEVDEVIHNFDMSGDGKVKVMFSSQFGNYTVEFWDSKVSKQEYFEVFMNAIGEKYPDGTKVIGMSGDVSETIFHVSHEKSFKNFTVEIHSTVSFGHDYS